MHVATYQTGTGRCGRLNPDLDIGQPVHALPHSRYSRAREFAADTAVATIRTDDERRLVHSVLVAQPHGGAAQCGLKGDEILSRADLDPESCRAIQQARHELGSTHRIEYVSLVDPVAMCRHPATRTVNDAPHNRLYPLPETDPYALHHLYVSPIQEKVSRILIVLP